MPQDKSLQMNQTIETAILQLQQSPTPEQLAHTLTVVRHCMQAGGLPGHQPHSGLFPAHAHRKFRRAGAAPGRDDGGRRKLVVRLHLV